MSRKQSKKVPKYSVKKRPLTIIQYLMQLKLCSRIILVGQKKRNKSYCKENFAEKKIQNMMQITTQLSMGPGWPFCHQWQRGGTRRTVDHGQRSTLMME